MESIISEEIEGGLQKFDSKMNADPEESFGGGIPVNSGFEHEQDELSKLKGNNDGVPF
jgi:hypothetical protein